MILKVIDETGAVIAAIQVYENNYDGNVSVMDTFHCKTVETGFDTIFGSNDQEVVVQIKRGE
ncbi:hypothetical protein [Methanobrevibacter sp.]|uniref:hypothetical protein n=1 Tax=Methanobrevibacter sp. TaxID=66852 RepID=UPI0038681487